MVKSLFYFCDKTTQKLLDSSKIGCFRACFKVSVSVSAYFSQSVSVSVSVYVYQCLNDMFQSFFRTEQIFTASSQCRQDWYFHSTEEHGVLAGKNIYFRRP